jgi:hypothetical protein
MPVQRSIDLLDGTVKVAVKRKGFRLGLLVRGTRHAKVLSKPPKTHKAGMKKRASQEGSKKTLN